MLCHALSDRLGQTVYHSSDQLTQHTHPSNMSRTCSSLVEMHQRNRVIFLCLGPVLYDLYALCNHAGTVNMGHYTALCQEEGGWCCYNDSW